MNQSNKRGRPRKSEESQDECAKFWHTSQQTMANWCRDGFPISGDRVVQAVWIKQHAARKNKGTREKLLEYLSDDLAGEAESISLEKLRDYYSQQVNKLTQAQGASPEDLKLYTDLFLKTDKQIRDSALDAKKLGIKEGETLTKDEIVTLIKNMIHAGNACVRNSIKEVCEVVANCETPQDVYKVLPPIILGGRIFEGAKVMKGDFKADEIRLPDWWIDAMQHEGENYLKGLKLK